MTRRGAGRVVYHRTLHSGFDSSSRWPHCKECIKMSKITTGSRLYAQKMSAALVTSGQHACSVHIKYLVMEGAKLLFV